MVTYIQSGNVIFETSCESKSNLKRLIEQAIEKKYMFNMPVELRTNREIAEIIENYPFGNMDLGML